MNVLAAVFLSCLPEPEALAALQRLVFDACPTYFQPDLEGCHAGAELCGSLLKIIDPDLDKVLESQFIPVLVWAFPPVMSFCANRRPFSEVLQIWDFFVANGFHLCPFAVVSMLLDIRDQLM